MTSFEEIINLIDTGENASKIALLFPWVAISLEDREALFAEAEEGDTAVNNLSRY